MINEYYVSGAVFCGKIADIYGRKRVMSITIVLLVISAVGAALASNKWIFLAWRSLAGACIGANFATVIVYSTEFSPDKHRSLGPLIAVMGSYMSMFIVNFAGLLFLNSVGWRWLIIIITIPIIPAWVLLVIMPESPRYLAVSGKNDEAMKAIKLMARINKIKLPENMKVCCHQNQELGSFKVLFQSADFRKPAILLSIMYFSNIFIETAVLVFLPLAFTSNFCGSGDTGPVRDRCAPLTQNDLWELSGAAFGSLVGCMGAYFIAKCMGRLKPLRGSNIIQIGVFCMMLFCLSNLYLFGVSIAIKVINAFICMMIWFIAPEAFPSIIRNTATGTINSSGKMGAVLGTAVVFLLFYVSPITIIICFLLVTAISSVCSFLLKKETKNTALTET